MPEDNSYPVGLFEGFPVGANSGDNFDLVRERAADDMIEIL
jgi:hypothetical protein